MAEFSKNLYSCSLNIAVGQNLGRQYRVIVGVRPSWNSDWKATSKAFRLPIFATLNWHINPRTNIMLGVIYLDRKDVPFLPIGGIVWRPNEELFVELMAPRARIAQRVRWFGSQAGNRVSDWLYVGAEVAGGTWAIRQDNVRDWVVEYFDYRAMIGYERKITDAVTIAFDVGYIFGRQVTVQDNFKYRPAASPFLRAKIVY